MLVVGALFCLLIPLISFRTRAVSSVMQPGEEKLFAGGTRETPFKSCLSLDVGTHRRIVLGHVVKENIVRGYGVRGPSFKQALA